MNTKEIISALESGTKANRRDPFRMGNLIYLDGPGQVIMTGDLHGHTANFEKLCRLAQLDKNPHCHLILHELLHSTDNPEDPDQCHSYRLLAHAAHLKAQFPRQLHILLGNHALAQVTRDEVVKNGQPMVRALNTGIWAAFNQDAGPVMQALDEFIMSMPIAARTDNRIWLSHSLPSKRHLAKFDNAIFEKKLTLEDMKDNHSLRALTWDRTHNQECLEKLREMWDVDFFIVGHQPQSRGCRQLHKHLIILASDHPHGAYLPFKLRHPYQPDELFDLTKPLAALE